MTFRSVLPIPTSFALMLVAGHPAHAQQQPAQAEAPAASKQPPDFWHRDTLTGDWGGLRTTLADQGIAISASYTAEVFANTEGGIKRGAAYDGAFLPQIDVDLDTLMGWHGASFRVSMLQGDGPALSPAWVGNFLGVSGLVVVPPATRLFNLWLEQDLFDKVLSVRVGVMNVDEEFMTTLTGSLFLNSTFGWSGWIAENLPGGGPAYPLSSPGVRVKLQPAPEGVYFQGAVFSGDPTGHNGSNNPATPLPSGTVLAITGGAFIIAEGGYAVNQGKDAKGPPLAFKLGGWYHTSNHFQDQRFDTTGLSLANPASNGIPLNHDGDWGFYASADASLYQTEDGGLSGFVRVAGSPGDRNLVSFYVDGGLAYKGLIPGRGDDTAGIALGYARIGGNARGLDQDTQVFINPLFPVRDQEMALEVSYHAQLTGWMTLQPDVQGIFHPNGHVLNPDGSLRHNALVLGLRSVLTF